MRRFRLPAILVSLAATTSVLAAPAPQSPHAGYVFPAGGRQGTSFVVLVGGQYIDGVTKATVSGSGVRTKIIESFPAMRLGQTNSFQERVKKLLEKKAAATAGKSDKPGEAPPRASSRTAWTDDDEMLLAATRKKLAMSLHAPPVPATAETVVLAVTIAADAEPGHREIRLEASKGITNPLVFCVGQLPEFAREVTNIAPELLTARGPRSRNEGRAAPPEPPLEITLPAVANGQIMPGGIDRIRFTARKGQRLVIAAAAEELIPYISDAVPGWFQAALTLYDAQGRELAFADHYLFHPDPILFHEVAEDGQYMVEIRDSIYRGREDFVYRLAIGEFPYITSVFPLGGPVGGSTAVELSGWNLPATQLTHNAQDAAPGVTALFVRNSGVESNLVPFALDNLPECVETEPNDQPAQAQSLTLPTIVNGRIDRPNDWDVFRFEGRAGAEIVAEVFARRLNSPLDSVFKLTDAAGRQLAYNDDHEDKSSGLVTHHADSYLRTALPADGTYYLYVGDTQHKGGPDYAYRLRIGPPRPDFELRIAPSSIHVRSGTSVPVTVYALRKDGFDGPIALALKNAPNGFMLGDESIPAGQNQAQLTLKIFAGAATDVATIRVEGRAEIDGRKVIHEAIPAENMMQAFEYRHLVPAQELEITMSGSSSLRPSIKLLDKGPLKIPVGGTARVRLAVSPAGLLTKAQFSVRQPTTGISVTGVTPIPDGLELVLQTDPAKVKPRQRGNVQLTIAPESAKTDSKTKPAASRGSLPNVPSIQFEIVPNSGSEK